MLIESKTDFTIYLFVSDLNWSFMVHAPACNEKEWQEHMKGIWWNTLRKVSYLIWKHVFSSKPVLKPIDKQHIFFVLVCKIILRAKETDIGMTGHLSLGKYPCAPSWTDLFRQKIRCIRYESKNDPGSFKSKPRGRYAVFHPYKESSLMVATLIQVLWIQFR